MILITKACGQTRQRRHTLSTCTILTQVLGTVCPPPPVSLLFSRLSGLAASGPNLSFLHDFLFPPKSPPLPTWRLQLLCGFLSFFTSLPTSTILSSFRFPFPSSSPFSSPLLLSFPSPLPSPFPSCVRSQVSTLVHVPVPAPSSLPFQFPLRPRPHSRPRLCSNLYSLPQLRSRPRPRSLLPVPRTRLSLRCNARVQAPGLGNGPVGCPQALPSVCIDADACGRKVPDRVYSVCMVSCASSSVFRPPRSRSRSRLRSHPRPRSHLCYCSRLRPRSRPCSHPVFIDESPPPSPFPFPPRPRSRPRSRPRFHSFVRLQPRSRSRSRSRFRSVPDSITVHVPFFTPGPIVVSAPAPDSDPAPDPVRSFPSLGPGYSLIRCACIDTGPCERSCRVLASATPCLQRWWRVRNGRVCC